MKENQEENGGEEEEERDRKRISGFGTIIKFELKQEK
jgi:hypothetical protein